MPVPEFEPTKSFSNPKRKYTTAAKKSIFQNKLMSGSNKRSHFFSNQNVVGSIGSEFMRKYSTTNIMLNMPKEVTGNRYQQIMSEIISQCDSVASTFKGRRSDKKDSAPPSPRKFNIIKPNLYYFETDNRNRVIETKLHLKENKTFDKRLTENKNKSISPFKREYGSKWYINPQKWNKMITDKISMQELQYGYNRQIKNLVTNSTLMKLVNNVAVKEKLIRKSEVSIPSPGPMKKSTVEEFEDDLKKVVEDKKK